MHLLNRVDDVEPGPVDRTGLLGLYRWPEPSGRAVVRSNFIATLDGSIQGLDGRSGSINTPSDHEIYALHRALADVILVGAGTVRAEGYRAVDLQPWQREIRAAEGLAPYPLLAVVTRSLHLDPAIADPLVEHGPVIIMTTQQHDEGDVRPLLAAGIEVRSHGRAAVDLAELTGDLAERGQSRILCEGGPRLHRDLLAAGLLDELSLTLSPSAVGGGGVRSTVGDPLPARVDFDLRFLLLAEDQTVFASYRRSTSPG